MASYFTDAQHFKIESFLALPQGNAVVYNGSSKSPLERLEENIAPGAMHNSSERCDAPKCHPQTRMALQRDIFAWMCTDEDPKRVVLLKGAKGTGKTAIAGSIADISQERGLLAGTFFFSSASKSANRRSKRYVIATLAYQLWQHPALRQHIGQRILSAIECDPVIFTRGMKAQMEELILEPLRAIQIAGVVLSNGPKVIIVDAIDECQAEQYHDPTLGSPSQGQAQRANEDDQLDILRVLLHAAASPVFPFRIIVTSRSEGTPSIAISECLEANPITVDISLDGRPDTDADMTAFLVARFAEIQRRHSLPLNWPHQGYILQLVANAAGSFRLASATMRNISENARRGVLVPPIQPQEPPDSIPDEGKDPEQPEQKQQVRWNVEPSQRIPMQVSTGGLERPADNQAKKNVPRQPRMATIPQDGGRQRVRTVDPAIATRVSSAEEKLHEAIEGVITAERNFVRDMEYLCNVWIKGIQEQGYTADFLPRLLQNVQEMLVVSTRFRDALNEWQKQNPVGDKIGDIFLANVACFQPFVTYAACQIPARDELETEEDTNPAFAAFVEHQRTGGISNPQNDGTELGLSALLSRPAMHLSRYPLLFQTVLQYTPGGSSDKSTLPVVIRIVENVIAEYNAALTKSEKRWNLVLLQRRLKSRSGEEVDLHLAEEGRELVNEGLLAKRDGELQVYLFDHAILFTKTHRGVQKVYRRPIPLEFLCTSSRASRPAIVQASRAKGGAGGFGSEDEDEPRRRHWIEFTCLGKRTFTLMLYASSALAHRDWLDKISECQQNIKTRSTVFDTVPLTMGFFSGARRVNCAVPFGPGQKVAYGADDGVYVSDLTESHIYPVKVFSLPGVVEMEVLEDGQLLILRSERQVFTFPVEVLDERDPSASLKKAKRISAYTSSIKVGRCLGRTLVAIVKASQLSTTIKTLEPIDQSVRPRSTFRRLLQGGTGDSLKTFREFYIPVETTSFHFLETKLCLGCSKGFEIVDLETLETQSLLDPNDDSLAFVREREGLRPLAIYRIGREFLLCYDEFAFYVEKSGRRSKTKFFVHWEGAPTGFALQEPYVLAFDPTFVEIRHIETGVLLQVIQGRHTRLLFADRPPSRLGSTGDSMTRNPSSYPPQRVGRDQILIALDDTVFSLQLVSSRSAGVK